MSVEGSLFFVLEKLFAFLLAIDSAKEILNFDFALQLHHAIEHRLGSGRTSGYKDIDGDNLIDTLYCVI